MQAKSEYTHLNSSHDPGHNEPFLGAFSPAFLNADLRIAASMSELNDGARVRAREVSTQKTQEGANRKGGGSFRSSWLVGRENSTKIPSPRMDPAEFPTDPHRRD